MKRIQILGGGAAFARLLAICTVAAIALATWTPIAMAQSKEWRVGLLLVVAPNKEVDASWLEDFRQSLTRQAKAEGKTVTLVMRDAKGDPSMFGKTAADLLQQKVDVIYADSAPATRAAFTLTKTIPIVGVDFTNDPIAAGYAKSYARPGGNVTGMFLDAPEFAAKWLEMVREIVPNLKRVAALWDPSPGDTHLKALMGITQSLGMQLDIVRVHTGADIDKAGDAFTSKPQAIVVLPSPMLNTELRRLIALQTKQRLPLTSIQIPFANAGGLLGYGPNDPRTMEAVANQIGKILRGTKAGDLPIERPIKFDLVVNLKAAKELNIKIPESVLTRADRVIR